MATLTSEQQRFIVQHLACFATPAEVSTAFRAQFGFKPAPAQVSYYNPLNTYGQDTSPEWKALFDQTRAQFQADTARIPIASRSYRLERLAKLAQKAEGKGAFGLAASIYEQAAKECGDVFTNRREVRGAIGLTIDEVLDASEDEDAPESE